MKLSWAKSSLFIRKYTGCPATRDSIEQMVILRAKVSRKRRMQFSH